MADEMMRVTLAIVGQTLFSKDVEHEASEIGKALTECPGYVRHASAAVLVPYSMLPLPKYLKAKRAQKFLDRTIYNMIAERRASGADTGTCFRCCSWPSMKMAPAG